MDATVHHNLGTLFYGAAKLFPDKEAIVQDGSVLRYRDLLERTNKFCGLLSELGIGPQDKVALLMDNDYRFAECLFGIMQLGAVAVPLNVKLGDETLHYILTHAEVKLIVCSPQFYQFAKQAGGKDDKSQCLVLDDRGAYEKRLKQAPAQKQVAKVAGNDTALLMYTSGSTGRPKGCQLTHAGTLWMIKTTVYSYFVDQSDRALIIGPLYHANALWCTFYPMLYAGGTIIIRAGFAALDVLQSIDTYRPTYTSGTPAMFSLLLSSSQNPLASSLQANSLRLLVLGSAPVSAHLLSKIHKEWSCDVLEGYGSTEAGIVSCLPRWGKKKRGSMGIPLRGVAVKVVNAEEEACKPGEVGELYLKSPALLSSYHKNEAAYLKKMRDGWYASGDLVKQDSEGYLYFEGRTDDMINCGGENVFPKEVEQLLLNHPDVKEAVVLPVKHRLKGQAPVAWVVPNNTDITEEQLKQYALDNGPAYAHPRRVFFTNAIPLNGTEKVDYVRLKQLNQEKLPAGL